MISAPPIPTLREMVASCQRNADIAREKVDAIRNTLRNLGPGPERDQAMRDLSKFDSDLGHWTNYRGYYATRAAREGEGVRPSMGGFGRVPRQQVARDTRMAREPGDDDEEEAS